MGNQNFLLARGDLHLYRSYISNPAPSKMGKCPDLLEA